jgi:hypothetical protein
MADQKQRTASIFGVNLRTGTMALVLLLLCAMISPTLPAQAQTFTVLYNFTGDGANGAPYLPYAGLAITGGGNLYGTTLRGGTLRRWDGVPVEARGLGLVAERAPQLPGRQ